MKGGWREGEERVRRNVNPIPNPDPGLCEELVFAQNDLIVGMGPILSHWGAEEEV